MSTLKAMKQAEGLRGCLGEHQHPSVPARKMLDKLCIQTPYVLMTCVTQRN